MRHSQQNGKITRRTVLGGTAALLTTRSWAAATVLAIRETVLAIRETGFVLDDRPAFLLGISYYAGLGATEQFVIDDLADMRRLGFNWLRVWANWSAFGNDVSALGVDGSAREPYLGRLKTLLTRLNAAGMAVDVTLTRGEGRLMTHEAHRKAVETLVTALKPLRNWYLDLANERNVGDTRFASIADLKDLRELVRRLDPDRLVTASHGGDIGADELSGYVQAVKVDFIAPHRPRDARSAAQTEAKTREYLAQMRGLGRVVPVHYQEPFRRGYATWEPAVEDFVTDVNGARAGGAAGWCFHNGDQRGSPDHQPRRSFDLHERRLFDQLDEVERTAVTRLKPR